MKLDECRQAIDAIDTEILALLNRRAALSRRIGSIKLTTGLAIIDREREAEVLRRVRSANTGEMANDVAARIYREILDESQRIQVAMAAEAVDLTEVYV